MTTKYFKFLVGLCLPLFVAAIQVGQCHAALTIPDTPLFLSSTGVKPNFILTLDDSGSMSCAFVPDSIGVGGDSCATGGTSGSNYNNTHRFKSSYYNGMYYNPTIQYTPPPKYNGTICSLGADNPSTCYDNVPFTGAPINGFDTTRGKTTSMPTTSACNPKAAGSLNYSPINLSDNYAANTSYDPSEHTLINWQNSTIRCATADGETTTPPPSTQPYSATCQVDFDNNTTNDRIHIDSGCAGIFSALSTIQGTLKVTGPGSNTGASRYNASTGYTVSSINSSQAYIYLGSVWSGSTDYNNQASVTLSFNYLYTPGAVTTYPAHYYLFYSELGLSRPAPNPQTGGTCTSTTANQKTDDNCYIKINAGSAGGGTGGWLYADPHKNANGTAATTAQKQQNFANWYSYYRTRNLALASNVMTALTGLDDTVRVAWQGLNTCDSYPFSSTACKGWNNPASGYDQRIQALGGTITNGYDTNLGTKNANHRQELYAWLSRQPANSSTPLLTAADNAGKYVASALSATSPYAENPPSSAGTYHSCRRNVHLMMTDGIWRGSISGFDNANSTSTDLPGDYRWPDGSDTGATSWTPGHPYSDSNSNNLADIAFKYWATDLQSGLDDNITPLSFDSSGTKTAQWVNPKNDPAVWQHMTTYAIGLGLSSVLVSPNPVWGGDTYSGDYTGLVSGSKTWPATGDGTSPGNAYDLWHAAISGRGKFYSAEDSADLKLAFKDVVDTVSSQAGDGGGAGLGSNSTKVSTDTTVYEAKFKGDWSGTLEALSVQTTGSNAGNLGTSYWEASQLIPLANLRNIYTLNGGSKESFTNCSGPLATALNKNPRSTVSVPLPDDDLCTRRLAWLRGYQAVTGASWASNTVTFTVPSHGFATGDSVVISGVTSSISGVASSAYNGTYSITVTSSNSFTATKASDPGTFSTAGKARYANFRDRTNSVLGDIMNSDPSYAYKDDFGYGGGSVTLTGHGNYSAYVTGKASGTPMVYVGANDGMLHAFGADTSGTYAGKELFAYVPAGVYANLGKLTDPLYAGDKHKYFVDGSPTVGDAYLNDANSDSATGWNTVLVSGLGAGGKSIFALDITKPTSFTASKVKWEFSDAADLGLTYSQPQIAPDTSGRWVTVFGNGYNSTSDRAYLYVVNLSTGTQIAKIAAGTDTMNGLATPYLYDSNGDKIADVAYAGDLLGNLWKFVNTSGTWTLGNGDQPLFTAIRSSVTQPITSQPKVAVTDDGKRMVYFGTGSYLTTDDLTDDHSQTFYAIWDNEWGSTVTLATLQPQTFTTSGDYRTVDSIATPVADPRGWYMDFPATAGSPSERILSAPLAKNFTTIEDRVIFVTTIPTSDPCDRGGGGWLMELKLETGGQTTSAVLDYNNDGTVDGSDTVVAGKKLPPTLGITKTPLWLSGGTENSGYAFKLFTGSKGTTHTEKQTADPEPPPGGAPTPTRIYWQQIL